MGGQQDSVQDPPAGKGRGLQRPRAEVKRVLWAEQSGCRAARQGLQRPWKNRDPQRAPESSCYEKSQPGLLEHTCYPNFKGAKAEGWGEFKASLGHRARLCLK